MEIRNLGKSGLKVSSLCLGTMTYGGRTEFAEAKQIVTIAKDAGINFLDTANAYNQGKSEAMVKELVRDVPSDWVVATKVFNAMGDGPNQRGLSRRHIMEACRASLRRLGRETIDIYYLHKEDHAVPMDETVSAIGDLIRKGMIQYWGLSNFRAWRIAEIIRVSDALGVPRPIVLQPHYNILNRMAETEVLPCCSHFGMGVVPYSPVARGVLTGKYLSSKNPDPESRAGAKDKRMMETEWRPESLQIAQKISDQARSKNTTPTAFAIAWLLNNQVTTSPIIGPRTTEQMRDYLAGVEYQLEPEDEVFIDRLVAPGHASTPNFVDPAYPIEGRYVQKRRDQDR